MTWLVPDPWHRSPSGIAAWTLAITCCVIGIGLCGASNVLAACCFFAGALVIAIDGEIVVRHHERRSLR